MQGVGVDLDEDGLALHLLGEFFEDGRYHAAGTAAVGVKVDDDGEAGDGGVFGEEAVEFVRAADVTYDGAGEG